MTRKRIARRATLLDLVQSLQGHCRTDPELVALVARLVNSGRVILTGNFAGQRISLQGR
jgi:hypothetical protein